jgi:hypothetical protein
VIFGGSKFGGIYHVEKGNDSHTRDEHYIPNIVSHRKRFISLNFFAPVRKMSECFSRQQTKITLVE